MNRHETVLLLDVRPFLLWWRWKIVYGLQSKKTDEVSFKRTFRGYCLTSEAALDAVYAKAESLEKLTPED